MYCTDSFITILAIFIAFVFPMIFYHLTLPSMQPVDPLTALFYEVSSRIESVNCTFTHSALQQLQHAHQIMPSPLHRAVYVFLEATLHRWATSCL
jgi:hypothetical protein